ncbi:MAG: twin-arginine translocase TatA/TatE family subunit [Rhodoblastus sp.]
MLFGGKGKISDIMGDVRRGIKSFKKGMAEDDKEEAAQRFTRRAHEDHRPPGRRDGRQGRRRAGV